MRPEAQPSPSPEALAALHALCFTDAPSPWRTEAFAGLLSTGAFLIAEAQGFALGRVAGPEAELLTLAVHPAARRQGLARRLLAAFEAEARARGAEEFFLEVSERNKPARALYAGAGWIEAGRRKGYYGPGIAALVLRKPA